jgi:aminoglycoside phosphotransferase (APT) family kinase protein
MAEDDVLIEQLTERSQAVAQSWRPGSRVVSVAPLTGGASSLTFTVRFDGVDPADEVVVLKVAPPGLPPVRNRDVLRQGIVMRALADRRGVVVPEVLFEDRGDPPEVSPFLAMNMVPGECLEPMLQAEPDPARAGEFRERAFDAARVLAAMHQLEPAVIGLAEEPVIPIKAEIDRWVRAYETSPPHLQFNCTEISDALYASVPEAVRPAVNHGDYRLGNTLCVDGRLTAIIDWEIWSVGDPRVDLTWLTFFADDSEHPSKRAQGPTGMPTGAEILAGYIEAGGQDYPDIDWFNALTFYKEAALTSLLVKRAQKGSDPVLAETMTAFIPGLKRLLDMAGEILSV